MNKKIDGNTLIKDLDDITVRAKNVLKQLGVFSLDDLRIMYETDSFPKTGTVVRYYPFSRTSVCYSNKVNEEIKELLREHWDINNLSHVGAS